MKRKICFIAQFPPPIHGLSKAVDTLYRSELAEKYEFEAINITDNRKFPANLLRMARSDADLFYFTISQSRGGNLRDLAILKLLQLRRKKCVIHLHGGYYRTLVDGLSPAQKRANFSAVSRLAGAIVLGPSLKCIFRDMLPEEKIFTVPNCVDDQYLMDDDAFAAKRRAAAAAPVRQVLYLSNFIPEKGWPTVLELARQEKRRAGQGNLCRYHFHFAGKFFDPAAETAFHDFIRTHGLTDGVTYHGVVQGEAKQRLLTDSHIFILPTRYPKEGQPISILEAMGNGMMIVTTDHAGIPDIVTDGENGIVLTDEARELPGLLTRMDEADLPVIMSANRARVMASFRERDYLDNMDRVFASVMG